jgi:holin-like protein
MLNYLTLVFSCQLAGEMMVTALRIPLPGPVLGMVLLFVFLSWKGGVPQELARIGDALLSSLSLLFVPAGVGVMAHFALLRQDWFPLSVAIIGSTLVTIAVTAGAMVAINQLQARKSGGGVESGKDTDG